MGTKSPTANARNPKEDTMKINGKNVRDLTNMELDYHRRELAEVITIQETFGPAGLRTPKLTQYLDEQAAVGTEIARRQGRGQVRLTLTEAQIEVIHTALLREITNAEVGSVDAAVTSAAIDAIAAARQ